jgi:hypothetical protein
MRSPLKSNSHMETAAILPSRIQTRCSRSRDQQGPRHHQRRLRNSSLRDRRSRRIKRKRRKQIG